MTRWCAYLGGREHAAAAAHVTEGTLTGAVGTTTGDARNTRHGATGTPRLGGGLVTGLGEDSVRLAVVLVEACERSGSHVVQTTGQRAGDCWLAHATARANLGFLNRSGGHARVSPIRKPRRNAFRATPRSAPTAARPKIWIAHHTRRETRRPSPRLSPAAESGG